MTSNPDKWGAKKHLVGLSVRINQEAYGVYPKFWGREGVIKRVSDRRDGRHAHVQLPDGEVIVVSIVDIIFKNTQYRTPQAFRENPTIDACMRYNPRKGQPAGPRGPYRVMYHPERKRYRYITEPVFRFTSRAIYRSSWEDIGTASRRLQVAEIIRKHRKETRPNPLYRTPPAFRKNPVITDKPWWDRIKV